MISWVNFYSKIIKLQCKINMIFGCAIRRFSDVAIGAYFEYRYVVQSLNRYIHTIYNCAIDRLDDLAM